MLSAQWLNKSSDFSARVAATAQPLVLRLSQPAQLRRIRQLLIVLFAVWAVFALARIVWVFVPGAEQSEQTLPNVINPVSSSTQAAAARQLDIEKMRGWHLFGQAGVAAKAPPPKVASVRDGIEKGARETRLNVKLRGILASTEDGLGHAIIEHKSRQAIYAVEDKLPLPGRVVLAKVMPRQVILNNGGTYERLELFEKESVGTAVLSPPTPARSSQIDKRNNAAAAQLATSYRDRLYKNPQSLAEVVSVASVREGGVLQGYRISPGTDRDQFKQLGFKAGDVVTGINGVALDSPASTMKLYNMLRTASDVTFELTRDDQPVTLSVNLDSAIQ